MIALAGSGWCLGDPVPLRQLPEWAGLDDAERAVCEALGIESVAVADASATDLAAVAARRALAAASRTEADVDVVITVEARAPETLISSDATRLQAALGARRAMAFSVGGLGCASLTPALMTAAGLLRGPDVRTVLVAHGSKPATSRRYRHPVTVNGDSGGALVLTRAGGTRIRDVLLETNGDYADLFRVPYRDRPFDEWREECADPVTYSFRLAVETRNRLRDLTSRLLTRNGLTAADVTCFVAQNLSRPAQRNYAEILGAPLTPSCAENLTRYAHLGPNDTFHNLHTATVPAGSRVVLLDASPTAAWSAVLVETGAGADETHLL
ncbi:3-oxoacyl-ACP synthase [Saccharothrix texasensis]|uniref:3-oxoacyl-[acyl-carrier-protein] synthase-3 n=1 Tax=Saccharothrix texasensis TaxID=103734 RepID=A0A3N1HIN6_9PSEU|nr:3-oxoacyl-ACP synthase [Saccharothrix texasensis]ROP42393.1 3-oxoacyl-[acyl-carrier-protein] synthase-3 [Saccharothrix texasensis]